MAATPKSHSGSRFPTRCLAMVMYAALFAPMPTAAANYVRIKALWNGTYLYEASNQVRYGSPSSIDTSSHWVIEDYAGSKRIKNRATGNYMSIEHLSGYVESIPVSDAWMSPRWTLENAPTAGYTIIRNVWQNTNIIYLQDPQVYAKYGNVPTSLSSAQWLLEDAPLVPSYVRIKNLWTGAYLYEDTNHVYQGTHHVLYGSPASTDTTSHWLIEDYAGSKRIKNRATGNYMSIEHLSGYVESIPISDAWMSPRWTLESAPTAGYTIIRNVWQNTNIIHTQNLLGYAQYGNVPTTFASAQWLLENAPIAPIPAAGSYVRIKNLSNGMYLFEASNQVRYGTPGTTDTTAHWVIEDYAGTKRIRNRATGNYMSIEHLYGYVESIPISDVWMSARWTVENAPTPGYTIIRNVWQNTNIVHIQNLQGYAQYGNVSTSSQRAQWLLEVAPRGAAVPWVEYEAENGIINGSILGPSRVFGDFAAESSGRRAVRLDMPGHYVQITAGQPANSIVVRYVIPDAPMGGGMDATLSLYVNGAFRQKLNLTSKYAWSYGGEASSDNNPGAGGAHHFFDEARALVGDIPAGATVRLQKDMTDMATYYVVDLIDLERVPPPLSMPANFLSIVSCGATPNDGTDDGPAIQSCINTARSQGLGVWIPPGTFESNSGVLGVSDVTIRGAGMWYSTIHGSYGFQCTGDNCRYYDFAVLGESLTRQLPLNDGFTSAAGSTGSRMENIWVEHTQVGYWAGVYPRPGPNGLVITGSRFRNTFADGVNLCEGASNSEVVNSHFRNTGDDGVASWSRSDTPNGVNLNNIIHFNTVQIPWRGNCYAIYGGQDNKVEDNVCSDVVTYPGILIAQEFTSFPFAGITSVRRNNLVRAGGPMWNQQHGALKIWAYDSSLSGLLISDIDIVSPTYSGLQIDGVQNDSSLWKTVTYSSLTSIGITDAGTWGIHMASGARGDATFTGVVVANPGSGGLGDESGARFTVTRGDGNSGW
ncbi:MAG: hypothetical protein E6J55_06640 [Deltaproteobacteria bacterium]|nr:MAG: hypothetical protein E6J55_06640 [Deltaproteobacteria bacterium]